jgi:hypothetical protein
MPKQWADTEPAPTIVDGGLDKNFTHPLQPVDVNEFWLIIKSYMQT